MHVVTKRPDEGCTCTRAVRLTYVAGLAFSSSTGDRPWCCCPRSPGLRLPIAFVVLALHAMQRFWARDGSPATPVAEAIAAIIAYGIGWPPPQLHGSCWSKPAK